MRYKNPANTSVPVATIYETPDASKESLNLLTLVAELYNAGVVGPKLIYDLIRGFIDAGLGEQEVEALLKVVKREAFSFWLHSRLNPLSSRTLMSRVWITIEIGRSG